MKKKGTKGCEELVAVTITPFRCSRGHLIINSRPKDQAEGANCDRMECQDNSSAPVQIGPRQKIKVVIWSKV